MLRRVGRNAQLLITGSVTRVLGTLVCAVTLLALAAGARAAEAGAPALGGVKLDFGLSAGFAAVDITNAHFGLGVGGLGGDRSIKYMQDVSRVEAYLAPRLEASREIGQGTLSGCVRVVGAATRGDGDPWYLTKSEPSNLAVDNLYLKWKSGSTDAAAPQNGFEASFGRQDFQLGDGMVLVDGNDEANDAGAIYWLDPQKGWENAAVLRLKAAPVRAELFTLRTNDDSANDAIVGGNLELVSPKLGTLGVSYFRVTESDFPGRDELEVAGVHGRGRPIPALPILELAGEIDFQSNDRPEKDARAWFGEAILSLYNLPWYPTIGYRYASFSGDDASTAKDEGWDWLHNGSTARGFGYWYQGIVVGTYETRLSNLDTHFVNLTVAPPIPGAWAKLLYYNHRFNDRSTARLDGKAVSSDHFANEWDVMLGYSPSKNVDYIAIYGTATPGRGGQERNYGADGSEHLIQFVVLYRY